MEKWAFITVIFYIALVVVLFVPALAWIADIIFEDSFTFFSDMVGSPQYWVLSVIIVGIQALLLLFPVKAAAEPPQPQRVIWVPIIATGLLFSILLLGIIWSIAILIWGDEALFFWGVFGFVLISWGIWSWVFYRFTSRTDPKAAFGRFMSWLVRGSILELLVAVPSHIIVRRRQDCCTPGMTFLGITAGVVIMALAFGPGLYFLFKKRFENMKPRSKRKNELVPNQ